MKMCDLTGQRFGNLIVIGLDNNRRETDLVKKVNGEIPRVRLHWICECQACGNQISVQVNNLKSGQTRDCGCIGRKRKSLAHKKFNQFNIDDTTCTIIASNTGNSFLIDRVDYEMVRDYCWHETRYGYLASRIKSLGKIVLLHRMLVFGIDDVDNPKQVDHIDRNKNDCRRKNLRVCNPIENSRNKSITPRNTSGRVGVSYDKTTHKWRAYVSINKKYISLGYYCSFDDAVAAREAGEIAFYKDFAPAG